MNINAAQEIWIKTELIRNGKVVETRGPNPHMITDWGLDQLICANLNSLTEYTGWHTLKYIDGFKVGNGSATPIRRNGGAITFDMSSGVITTVGAASFFVASDVGRLFKFGSGSTGRETYITGYVSDHEVTCDDTVNTETGNTGVVWYTNTAALVSEITSDRSSFLTGSGTTSVTDGNYIKRTHNFIMDSTTLSGSGNVTELILICHGQSSNNGFDRETISPSIAYLTGDVIRLTVNMVERIGPINPITSPNVGTGINTEGDICFECNYGLPYVTSSGSFYRTDGLFAHRHFVGGTYDYNYSLSVGAIPSTFTQSYTNSTSESDGISTGASTNRTGMTGVTSGSVRSRSVVTLKKTAGFTVSQANIEMFGIGLCPYPSAYATCNVKFDTSFTKANTHKLTNNWKFTITRTLTN